MATRNQPVTCPAGSWVELTNGDSAAIGFQVKSGYAVEIAGTVGGTAPSGSFASWRYGNGQGEPNTSLATLFPGLTGVNRVWARAEVTEAVVAVSHA